jgi:hypothetical protein
MPCRRCGARQQDPVRGASPWKRAVVAGEQVLVCPACQRDPAWTDGLDHCPSCGSTALVKALGVVSCRGCGQETPGRPVASTPAPGIADEVDAALRRVLHGGRSDPGSLADDPGRRS